MTDERIKTVALGLVIVACLPVLAIQIAVELVTR
jgi:hypothetical protein